MLSVIRPGLCTVISITVPSSIPLEKTAFKNAANFGWFAVNLFFAFINFIIAAGFIMFVLLFCALHFKYILLVLHLQFPEYPAAIALASTRACDSGVIFRPKI